VMKGRGVKEALLESQSPSEHTKIPEKTMNAARPRRGKKVSIIVAVVTVRKKISTVSFPGPHACPGWTARAEKHRDKNALGRAGGQVTPKKEGTKRKTADVSTLTKLETKLRQGLKKKKKRDGSSQRSGQTWP